MPKKKIGPEVDEKVWEKFRNYVREKRGGTRGKVGPELEKALSEYMNETYWSEVRMELDDINHRLSRMEKRLDEIDDKLDD